MKDTFTSALLLMLAVMLAACTTIETPEGVTETRFDTNAYAAVLASADAWADLAERMIALYEETEAEPEPSTIDQLLSRSDEILDFVERFQETTGTDLLAKSTGSPDDGLKERIKDIRSRALALN